MDADTLELTSAPDLEEASDPGSAEDSLQLPFLGMEVEGATLIFSEAATEPRLERLTNMLALRYGYPVIKGYGRPTLDVLCDIRRAGDCVISGFTGFRLVHNQALPQEVDFALFLLGDTGAKCACVCTEPDLYSDEMEDKDTHSKFLGWMISESNYLMSGLKSLQDSLLQEIEEEVFAAYPEAIREAALAEAELVPDPWD
jgi:hypothetical protein